MPSNYLITGGTGFLGYELTRQLLADSKNTIVIFSRSESKQNDMQRYFGKTSQIKYVLGDIRSFSDLKSIRYPYDWIIHAAAIKALGSAEKNVQNLIEINVNGTMNLLKLNTPICYISTDKACLPHTAYGASKYLAEQLIKFSYRDYIIARYGNVLGSTGSVFTAWIYQYAENKKIKVHNPKMSRFFWDVTTASKFVLDGIIDYEMSTAPKKFIFPTLQSINILELAKYLFPNAEIIIEEACYNEKEHETLIGDISSDKFVVSPKEHKDLQTYLSRIKWNFAW